MPDKTQAQQILDDLDPVLSKNPHVRSASVVETEAGMEVRIPITAGGEWTASIDSGALVPKLMEVHKALQSDPNVLHLDWCGYMVDGGVGLTFYTEWSRAEDVDAFYQFGWFRGIGKKFCLVLTDHESHREIKVWKLGADPSASKIMKVIGEYEAGTDYKAPTA